METAHRSNDNIGLKAAIRCGMPQSQLWTKDFVKGVHSVQMSKSAPEMDKWTVWTGLYGQVVRR